MGFGAIFFFFLCFWRLMIGLTRFQEYFLCVLGNNELKICFWMKKNKNPIFSATTVAEIWGIINDWCALYFFFVKEWGGWHIVHTINLKKKKKLMLLGLFLVDRRFAWFARLTGLNLILFFFFLFYFLFFYVFLE